MNLENEVPAVENAVLETASSGLSNGQKIAIGGVAAALVVPFVVWGCFKLFNHIKKARKSKEAVPQETADTNSENAN